MQRLAGIIHLPEQSFMMPVGYSELMQPLYLAGGYLNLGYKERPQHIWHLHKLSPPISAGGISQKSTSLEGLPLNCQSLAKEGYKAQQGTIVGAAVPPPRAGLCVTEPPESIMAPILNLI